MSEYFACIHGVHGGIDSKTSLLPGTHPVFRGEPAGMGQTSQLFMAKALNLHAKPSPCRCPECDQMGQVGSTVYGCLWNTSLKRSSLRTALARTG